MSALSEFFKSKRVNDSRGIQKALRRLDTHILALSLVNIDEKERDIFYRNTTKRVADMTEKEIEAISLCLKNENAGKAFKIAGAEDMVAEELNHWTNDNLDEPIVQEKNLPEVKLGNFEDILKTFAALNDQSWKYGLLSIDGIENKTDHVLFQKGMELILDGTDPMIVEEIMENYVKSLSNKYTRELKLISCAIKLIQQGAPTYLIIEKLKSLENA